MSTRAEELIAQATRLDVYGRTCPCRLGCAQCNMQRRHAIDLARTALLAALRKQRLRVAYFTPDAERAALREQIRIALDRTT